MEMVASLLATAFASGPISPTPTPTPTLVAIMSNTVGEAFASTTASSTINVLTDTLASTIVAEPHHFLMSTQLPTLARQLWAWQPTFMQGFILGQLSMLILLVMAIKYVLFEEPLGSQSSNDHSTQHTAGATTDGAVTRGGNTVVHEGGFGLSEFMIFSRKPKEPKPNDLAEELAKMHKDILSRTAYDLMGHAPESCDWLTVFLAQIIAKFRADAERHDRLVRVISEALNGELRPSVIDNIRITQFSLGADFLRITSARMVPSTGSLGMRAELDLALHDDITLGFNTRVLVNWPRPSVAALPVTMVVSLVKFIGTVAIEFDSASLEPSVVVSILPDYVLDFDVQTLIGSKAKVQNLPMLTSVISRKLQAAFAKELVMPNEKRIKIKHPFTPKPPAPTTSAHASAASTSQHQHTHSHPQQGDIPRSPVLDTNQPISPIVPTLTVAELPPDYNTQLPPPHPLRSTANSRAAVAVPNTNLSPPMGLVALPPQPPRMFTPEEHMSTSTHSLRSPVVRPQQPQPLQRSWSPESSIFAMSPQMRPIVGLSSSSVLGPNMVGSRIFATGHRLASGGLSSPLMHTPSLTSAFVANGRSASSASRQNGSETDDLQVKDSVRQRVNRMIRTVNES
ncbi:ERMES complex subunit mmm1 [Coemansia furcata]|uniref:ERMES complex subunit mmm1 n=1 Tax=Coemansia furcata TaxID=417177 RepID=A0ACC1LPC6_9FUNG|nr:ERMES complex subunit mmm1 [Coemansia furcata]